MYGCKQDAGKMDDENRDMPVAEIAQYFKVSLGLAVRKGKEGNHE